MRKAKFEKSKDPAVFAPDVFKSIKGALPKKRNDFLCLQHSFNSHSQGGEDGILAEVRCPCVFFLFFFHCKLQANLVRRFFEGFLPLT